MTLGNTNELQLHYLQSCTGCLQDSGSASGVGSLEVQELKEEITRQQNTICTLQTQQSTNQSTHQQMKQEIAALEEQSTSYQEQVIVLLSIKDELEQRINAVVQEKVMLSTHQQMEQEIAALEEQNTSYQEQVIVLQSTKDELE